MAAPHPEADQGVACGITQRRSEILIRRSTPYGLKPLLLHSQQALALRQKGHPVYDLSVTAPKVRDLR
jgi:hypothetical protein